MMQSMTLDSCGRRAKLATYLASPSKDGGGAFIVQIVMRTGSDAVLAKARSSEPRRFGNPTTALHLLRDVGITEREFDVSE
jgi:hypothetical protein